ncbi:MAG TPA: DUF4367 domain-containing protein [Thermoclostridium sp.]|nr:DUF4367 domain-containing protein [Thermoclostridium sp.]
MLFYLLLLDSDEDKSKFEQLYIAYRDLIIFVLTFSTILIRVDAVRQPVFRFFIEVYEKFSSVIFPDMEQGIYYPESIEKNYKPKYIPEGYTFSESIVLTTATQFIYSNKNGDELIFTQYIISSNSLNVDTEGVDIQKISIDEKEALFYSNKGINNLIWTDSGYGYLISGKINRDEIIKMMKSVH